MQWMDCITSAYEVQRSNPNLYLGISEFADEPAIWVSLNFVLSTKFLGDFDRRTVPNGTQGLME